MKSTTELAGREMCLPQHCHREMGAASRRRSESNLLFVTYQFTDFNLHDCLIINASSHIFRVLTSGSFITEHAEDRLVRSEEGVSVHPPEIYF